jgi:hypothetical protein
MYVKALRKGMFDLARNGTFVEIRVGQVFQVPDDTKIKPTSWVVRCDKQGNVIDPVVARKDADKAREKANKEQQQAKEAAARAAKEAKEAEEAEKRAKELEEEANKGKAGQGDQPPPK